MQEVPSIGRNPVYIVGLALFVIFQIPPLFADRVSSPMAVILVFRTLAGAVGSPALATGGASMGDIWMGPYYGVALVSPLSSSDSAYSSSVSLLFDYVPNTDSL
jgi:DHA1 family multidrug resistance protein-like MFS transporter